MKTLSEMTKDERSLLTYLETCLVDQRGKVESVRMNEVDFKIIDNWKEEGFITFQRLPSREVFGRQPAGKKYTNLVGFSEQAWAMAHAERRARAERNQIKSGLEPGGTCREE